MHQFHIYKNNVGTYEAVKEGWSWPGFFFTWIWCFVKKVNSAGGWVLAYDFFTWFIYIDITLIVIGLGINIWLGLSGNELRKKNLRNRGYEFQGNITSLNPEAAISKFVSQGQSEDIDHNIDDSDFTDSTMLNDFTDSDVDEDSVVGSNPIYLEFLNGSLSGQRIMVFKDTTIGRSIENKIVLSEKTISASHCRIKVVNDEFVIEDLNSTNGTFIDGQKISKEKLKQGNELQLSSIKIKVH